MDEKKVLFDVLDIIGYEDNKMEFVQKFFSLIYIEAIAEITTNLSAEDAKKMSGDLEKAADEEEQKEIMLRYLSKEIFDKKLTEITQSQFTDYLETIFPTLTVEKETALKQYLSSLSKPE